jgi:ribosomal protein L11 methyltransferase
MGDPYFTLTTELETEAAELASEIFHGNGCTGLELRDGSVQSMPGQRQPAPGHALLVGYFSDEASAVATRTALAEEYGAKAELVEAQDQDWSESWKKQVRSVVAGRLWVGPPWDRAKASPQLTHIVIEPGMAFGTGDHATTRFCLESVDAALLRRPGVNVLDVGTGSGVLAIAARKQGAGRVMGTDNDPVAIRVSLENAEINGAKDIDFSTQSLDQVSGTFDIVLANILANTLVDLAPALAAKLAPRGELYLAGILAPQVDEVLAAYVAQGLKLRERRLDGEWALLAVERA